MNLNAPNREAWLAGVLTTLRTRFKEAGYDVPENIKVTCGFPSKSATSRKAQRIGECWDSERSDAHVFELFISPVLADPLQVSATVAHEMVHAVVGLAAGHKAPFKRCAEKIGLTGKMSATQPGEAFKQWFAYHEPDFGPYPHAMLHATSAPRKQTTRMLKVVCEHCATDGKPYIVRLSSSALEMGAPICPIHNEHMTEA